LIKIPKDFALFRRKNRRLPWLILGNFSMLLAFWIFLFDFQRLIFILANPDVFEKFPDWLGVFFYSLRLDIATAAFMSTLPMILFSIICIFPKSYLKWIFFGVVLLEMLISCAIHSGEIIVYVEWKHKLTSKVFLHLFHGAEVVRTADNLSIGWFVILLILEFFIGFIVFWYVFIQPIRLMEFLKKKWDTLLTITTSICLIGISFLFARGGWQQIPINIDSAYYSEDFKLNDISINSTYFFANSYLLYLKSDLEDLVPTIDAKEANEISKSLYNKYHQDTTSILLSDKPNVVLIILEGWSANAMGYMHHTIGATPNFDRLVKNGLLFSNIYATNTTSEIGHTSILAGFPALPETAISSYPEKHRKLNTLNESLKKAGYHSGYLFGGDLSYGNIEGFIKEHHMDEVWDEDDFPSGYDHGKLSYHDEDVYTVFLSRINKSSNPFFRVVFTGSTHAPYDHPSTSAQNWTGKEADYMNSMIYADQCLADFMRKAKEQSWYKNTLFVIVSDHSHSCPTHEVPYTIDFFKIPLLFYGEVLKETYRGKIIDKIGSQADLAATLLTQLKIGSKEYPFSKNLIDPSTPDFAFLATVRGYGFTSPLGKFIYHFDAKRYHQQTYSPQHFPQAKKWSDALFKSYYEFFKNLEFQ
jgi:phosphoglycerol transferase MdoB-like AlkP superfamily enzyme